MCEFITVLTYNFQKIKRSFEVVLEVGSFLTCSVCFLFSIYGLKHQLNFTTSQKSCNSIGFLMEISRIQILHFYYCNQQIIIKEHDFFSVMIFESRSLFENMRLSIRQIETHIEKRPYKFKIILMILNEFKFLD